MRMVIEMPIEVKQEIGTWKGKFIIGEYDLIDAIKNGIILPEPHGRIIDESKITKCEQTGLIIKDDNVTRCLVTDAPTILEAREDGE